MDIDLPHLGLWLKPQQNLSTPGIGLGEPVLPRTKVGLAERGSVLLTPAPQRQLHLCQTFSHPMLQRMTGWGVREALTAVPEAG